MENAVEIVTAYDRPNEMMALIREYTEGILLHGDEVKDCLAAQDLEAELADMTRKYGLPYGRMYLALVGGEAAGSIALAKNDNNCCELKRLYVRPEYRGLHIGRLLMDKVIDDAEEIGYKHMRLDTFPFMEAAIGLYEKRGFYYIGKYNGNPAKSAIFMQLDL